MTGKFFGYRKFNIILKSIIMRIRNYIIKQEHSNKNTSNI